MESKKPTDLPSSLTGTGERRQSVRQPVDGRVRLSIDSHLLEGRAENISQTDVLFFTDKSLTVTVEIEEGGVVKRVPGQLVRLQRMRGGSSGWAVEFDR